MTTDFKNYQGNYGGQVEQSINFVGVGHDFFLELKANELLAFASAKLGAPAGLRVLDVGCGPGTMTRYLAGKVAGLAGADISPLLLEQARQAIPEGDFRLTDGAQLPFDSDSFDLVFATCAMHHVAPADRLGLLREMARVSTPRGLIVIMEHNPLNPLTRLAVARCEFDKGCVLLGMGCTRRLFRQADLRLMGSSYIAFFPWRGRPWRLVEKALRRVPLGAQYFIAGRKQGR